MNLDYLDFEQPIAEIQGKIDELHRIDTGQEVDFSEEISDLEAQGAQLTQKIFSTLKAYQIVQLARHPLRPHTVDYLQKIFSDFDELHGDRYYGDDSGVIGGLGRLENKPIMVIGQEKGRTTREKISRNFGMTKPEGFRKALRLMKLAERFAIPVITLIDTPGAYPGIDAEERNQSGAIARNIYEMSQLKIPIICIIIGEGCSGGALAIGVGDCTLMLQYAYYSVISPEGCASILWKNVEKAGEAAEALALTSERLYKLNLIDEIVQEPLGGAHRNVDAMAEILKKRLQIHLSALQSESIDALLERRYKRWLNYGSYG
ncbi:acetyl-CoA carboxylase carboxyltransferase subunit alpha [Coxiella endosymbiont of Amblyomma sculptum]|uniref:acetyl-CoA carboxylase carboxyltransferase subunit alpha n=1 Tax=Coxiella endosymbiont of Amblyomma sculptum TaxID=2487929 RepID=UPI00132F4822|nr:acetyl-CoA carboxylase carboxyltransferase subunit alpha [Coxiella endosymbiont of Amblyomma sculptum]QHG92290.1 acetyl-CoA carboxylase carboxyltransferase subunit alpha [Coxiella endosymbiont of Amblyomma sculptum]